MQTKKTDMTYVHLAIGVGIMLLFRFLPFELPCITPIGMKVLGIFIGTLYLWTTSDPITSSILAIFMIGISGSSNMNAVLTSTFGNPILVQCMFLLLIINSLVENRLTEYFGRFFLTRKICLGRPWVLVFFIMIGCVLMGAFMGGFTPIFLFGPILYDIFDTVGLKKFEKFPTIMLILVTIATLLGFPIPPFMGNGLALLTNYTTVTGNIMGSPVEVNNAGYLATGLLHAFTCVIVLVLFCKFVLRPDVSKLKNLTMDDLNKNPLPPMILSQKLVGFSFAAFVTILLIPSIAPKIAIAKWIKANTYGIAAFVVFLMCTIKISGKPLMVFSRSMKNFAWTTYFLIASAILLGSTLTDESTGVSAFLNSVLMPLFKNVPVTTFAIIIMLLTVVLTNLCNSFVIGLLLQPVIATFCMSTGLNSAPVVSMMILFVLSSAAITPAASPFAAMLFGNKDWLKPGEIYKYTLMFIGIELLVVLAVSLPIANMLLG